MRKWTSLSDRITQKFFEFGRRFTSSLAILFFVSACSPSQTDLSSLAGGDLAPLVVNGPLGNSALTFSPTSFSFGTLVSNSGVGTKVITVTNTSSYKVFLSTTLGALGDLSITANTCTNGLQMAPNDTCGITLQYAPTSAGNFSTAIGVPYADVANSSAFSSSIAITGAGTTLTGFGGLASIDTLTSSSMKLHWTDVAGASSYQVYSIVGGSPFPTATLTQASVCAAGACSYVVTGLTSASAYIYRVRGTDASGVQEGNIVNQTATTQNAATFSAISALAANEGSNAQTASMSCSDIYASANFFSITSQSDSTATCSLTATTGAAAKVSCTPTFHTTAGVHTNWSDNVTVQCAINNSNYSRTFAVNVTSVNRAPAAVIGAVTNSSPTATINTTTFAVTDSNTTNTTDIDGDQLNFTCSYTGGAVGVTPTNCTALPGTYSLGLTSGLFSWLPSVSASTSASPTVYTITITANDLQSLNNTATVSTVISVQPAVAIAIVTNRTFESGKTPVRAGTTFSNTFNNTQQQPSAGVTNMTYTCYYDQIVDAAVANTTACSTISGMSFAQNNTTGVMSFTPTADQVGTYEFKVCGTITSGASSCQIFVINVSDAYSTTNLVAYWDMMFFDLKNAMSGSLTTLQNLFNAGASSNFTTGGSSSATPVTTGSGNPASPLALDLPGNRLTAYHMAIIGGTAYNSQNSIALEQWINPAAPTDPNVAIVSNHVASATTGISIRQSPYGDGKVQVGVGMPYSSAVLYDTPTIYYRLSETSGTTITDYSGNGTTGTYSAGGGTVTLAQTGAMTGDPDKAVKVTGGATIKTPGIVTTGTGFSIEFWVNLATVNAQNTILNVNCQGCGTTPFYWLYYNSGASYFSLQAGSSNIYQNLSSNVFTTWGANSWHHVIMTVNTGTNVVKMYLDGNTTPIMNQTYTSAPAIGTGGAQSVYFGTYQNTAGSFASTATFDEVAIYNNTILTSTQVANHYATKINASCTSTHPLMANTWNHLVGLYDNFSGTLGMYLNGVSECTIANASTLAGSGNQLTYGTDPNMATPWNGKLSEARVYNPANLTAANTVATGNFSATKDRYNFSSTPSTISNLQAWFKADSLSLADGTAVASWTDSSTNAYTATQAIGSMQPIFKTNILNGKPVLRFSSAAGSWLDMGTVLGKPLNYTEFIIFKSTTTNPQIIMGALAAGCAQITGWGLVEVLSGTDLYGGTNSDGTNGTRINATSSVIVPYSYNDVAFSYANGSASAIPYLNGVTPAYSATNYGAGSTTNSGTASNFGIGRAGSCTSYAFDGDIAEVIIYNKVLSSAERARVEAYLKQKYGL